MNDLEKKTTFFIGWIIIKGIKMLFKNKFLFFVFFVLLFSACSNPPKPILLTENNQKNLIKLKNSFDQNIGAFSKKPNLVKLQLINKFLEKYPYITDIDNYNEYEHFATEDEFFSKMGGDCEDTAYIKYKYALKLGMIPDDFRFLIGKYINNWHIVLQYTDINSDIYVLERFNLYTKENYLKKFKEYQSMTIDEYLNHRKILNTNFIFKYFYVWFHEISLLGKAII